MIKVDRNKVAEPERDAERDAFVNSVRPSPQARSAPAAEDQAPAGANPPPTPVDTHSSDQDDFIGERRHAPPAGSTPDPASETVVDAPKPWSAAHPRVKANFQVRMPEELSYKLAYLSAYMVPHQSMHDIALDLITKGVDELLKLIPHSYPMPPTKRDKRTK